MATTNIDGPLPQMDFGPGWTITIESSVAATRITKLNVYGFTPAPGEDVAEEHFFPQFAYGTPTQ